MNRSGLLKETVDAKGSSADLQTRNAGLRHQAKALIDIIAGSRGQPGPPRQL